MQVGGPCQAISWEIPGRYDCFGFAVGTSAGFTSEEQAATHFSPAVEADLISQRGHVVVDRRTESTKLVSNLEFETRFLVIR